MNIPNVSERTVTPPAAPAPKRPEWKTQEDRFAFERYWVGSLMRGEGYSVIRAVNATYGSMAAVAEKLTDKAAKAACEGIATFLENGVYSSCTPEALATWALGLDPVPFTIVELLAFGSMSRSDAAEAALNSWL